MIFTELSLRGVYLISPERRDDERGFFARVWCRHELLSRGLDANILQCSISFSFRRGTLRGMHYQAAPHEEVKLVRCTMGSVYDVVVDLRPGSATFAQHSSVVLSAANRNVLYVPKWFAHGFQTLEDNTEVFYQMSAEYAPQSARGLRWNDPAFKITWPEAVTTMSDRDRNYPDFVVHAF